MSDRRFGVAAAGIVLLALALRAHRLDMRPYHHDEAIHAYEAYQIAKVYEGYSHDYAYDPTYHGPLRYYLSAAIFAVFGDGDSSGRALVIGFGVVLSMLALWLRPELGDAGALSAALLLAVSPLHVYYSRFLRDDPLQEVFTLLFYGLFFRGVRDARLGLVLLAVASLALAFITMENAYIVALVFALGMIGLGAFRVASHAGRFSDVLAEHPSIVQGLLMLLAFAGFNLTGALAADLEPVTRALSGTIVVALIEVVAVAALLHHTRRTPGSEIAAMARALRGPFLGALVFFAIYATAYTNAFVFPERLGAGLFSSLSYWTGQQCKPRLDGPFLYHVPLFLLHEPIIVAVPLILASREVGRRARWVLASGLVAAALHGIVGDRTAVTSVAEELVRGALGGRGVVDLVVAAALAVTFVRAAYAAFLARDIPRSFTWLWALCVFLLYGWAREKVPWLALHVALPFTLLTAMGIRTLQTRGRAVVLCLAILLAAHSRWLVLRGRECDTADPIVYVQTIPAVRGIVASVEEQLSRGHHLVLQADVTVPFYWYFRRHRVLYPAAIETVEPRAIYITEKGSEGAAAGAGHRKRSFYYYHSQVHAWARFGMGIDGVAELLDWLPAYLLLRDQTPFWKGGYRATLLVPRDQYSMESDSLVSSSSTRLRNPSNASGSSSAGTSMGSP